MKTHEEKLQEAIFPPSLILVQFFQSSLPSQLLPTELYVPQNFPYQQRARAHGASYIKRNLTRYLIFCF